MTKIIKTFFDLSNFNKNNFMVFTVFKLNVKLLDLKS